VKIGGKCGNLCTCGNRWMIYAQLHIFPSSIAERLRRRLCNQKNAGSNPGSGHLATPFRKEI